MGMKTIRFNSDHYHRKQEMVDWAYERFGKYQYWVGAADPTINWIVTSAFGITEFKFKRDADYMLFVLKWGTRDDEV